MTLFVLALSVTGGMVGFGEGAAVGTPLSVASSTRVTGVAAAPCTTTGATPARTTTHVVHAGESLSRIARAELGSGRLWGTIYRRNRSIIGPNPNLIRPGQTLVVPHAQRSGCPHSGQGNGVKPSPQATATATAPPPAVVVPTQSASPAPVPSETVPAVVAPTGAPTMTAAPTGSEAVAPVSTPSPSAGDPTTAPVTVPVTTPAADPSTATVAPAAPTTAGDQGAGHGSSVGSKAITWLAVAAGVSALVAGAIFLLGRRRKKPKLSDADRLMSGIREQMARDSANWPTRADYEALRTVRKQVPPIAGYRDGDTVYVKNATMGKLVGALHIDRTGALRELWERGDLTVQESRRARGEWSVQSRLLRSTAYAVKLPAH